MDLLNKFIWAITSSVIILYGISFSLKLKFPQFRWKKIFSSINTKSNSDLTAFDSLMMSLSSRIGIGSIAGIALAIKYGGIGSVFWIWIITIIVSSLSYLESIYGSQYKEKINDNAYIGGPHYYIGKALKNYRLALIYSLLMVVAYGIGFITIQTNTVSVVMSLTTNFSIHFISIAICITAIYCLFSNTNKKSKLVSKVVPFMTIFYFILGIWVIIENPTKTFIILKNIINQAFSLNSVKGGFIYTFIVGMQRAIFSTEVSIGTSAISSSMSDCDSKNHGYLQIFGNYVTTFIICTITVIIILTSDYSNYINLSNNGIELAFYAFSYHFAQFGKIFILSLIILFAYSTIISGFYYGETSLQFVTKNKTIRNLYKLIVIFFIFISTYVGAEQIWTLIDIFVAFLCLINIYAITKIYKMSHK